MQKRPQLVSLLIAFCLLLFFVHWSIVTAQLPQVDELKQNISDNQDEIQKLETEIADYKTRLNNVGSQKKTLQSTIQILDLTRAKLAKDVLLTQIKIARTNTTIIQLGAAIEQKKTRIEKNKGVIAGAINRINELGARSLIEILLTSSSISQFFIEIDNLARLETSLRDSIRSLKRLASELNEQKSSSQKNRDELLALKAQLADQKLIADGERREQATLLTETKNQESRYAKLLTDREARKNTLEKELREYESTLKFILDFASIPEPGTKVFAPPLDKIFITQQFGETVDSARLYTTGTHNGTDFRASVGTPVKAMLSGTVTGTGDTDRYPGCYSYGKWVLIKHDNGLSTLYAHFSLIKAVVGERVPAGEIIGYSGYSGYVDPPGPLGAHLHVTLLVSKAVNIVRLGDVKKITNCANASIPVAALNAYLDPLSYL